MRWRSSWGCERIFALEVRVGEDDARQRAMDRRTNAFGGGIGSLHLQPKSDDVSLTTSELRLEPIWHVGCRGRRWAGAAQLARDRQSFRPRSSEDLGGR